MRVALNQLLEQNPGKSCSIQLCLDRSGIDYAAFIGSQMAMRKTLVKAVQDVSNEEKTAIYELRQKAKELGFELKEAGK